MEIFAGGKQPGAQQLAADAVADFIGPIGEGTLIQWICQKQDLATKASAAVTESRVRDWGAEVTEVCVQVCSSLSILCR